MTDFHDSVSSDEDQQCRDEEGSPAWDTAPGNDDGEEEADDNRSNDNDVSDGDFEDAWLGDYLMDVSTSFSEIPASSLGENERQENSSHAVSSHRSSLVYEMDPRSSFLVVDAAGKAVVSVSSPRLASLVALEKKDLSIECRQCSSASLAFEPSSLAMIHPVVGSLIVGTSDQRDPPKAPLLTPLSPSTSPYKRANSIIVGPSAKVPTKTMRSQQSINDDDRSGLPRPQICPHVVDTSESIRKMSSRILDEWKRKEMWQDLKRAEESAVAPTSKLENPSPSHSSTCKQAASDARLDTLLQTLQAEVTALPRHEEPATKQQKEPRRSSFRKRSSSQFTEEGERDGDDGSVSKHTRTFPPSTSSSPLLTPTTSSEASQSLPVSIASSISLSDFERLQQEKQVLEHEKRILQQEKQNNLDEKQELQAEAEKARDDLVRNQEQLRQLNEKLLQQHEKVAHLSEKQLHFDVIERENRILKEESQKSEIQALGSTELVKTLRDQLTLTSKSEEQLKLQTKQLLEQNQSLQADLLEKIASEMTKFQEMSKLSAQNESLLKEFERKAHAMKERDLAERLRMRSLVIRSLLRLKHRSTLRLALFQWLRSAQNIASARTQALMLLSNVNHGTVLKLKATAFGKLRHFAALVGYTAKMHEHQASLDAARQEARSRRFLLGLMHMDHSMDHWEHRRVANSFNTWKTVQRKRTALTCSLELGASKLKLVLLAQNGKATRRAMSKWQYAAICDDTRGSPERVQQLERSLVEAKECVFSLSRAKTKLEEKLRLARDETYRLTGELTESSSELQLAKHGFVTTVIRDAERAWLRAIFVQWRIQANVYAITKELRIQVEMAELKVAERDKHSKSLDDYSRVLRNDLERYQFFSLDKRITVDVLSKKLLREEERYRHMEERQVALEEKAHALKTQLSSFIEWDGLALPFSVLTLCKDVAVSNLRELFRLHAASDSIVVSEGGDVRRESGEIPTLRLSMSSLVRILEHSTLLEEKMIEQEALPGRLMCHLPSYAMESGLLFVDFVTGLNQFATELFTFSTAKHEQLKRFWASLFSLVGTCHARKSIAASGTLSEGDQDVNNADKAGTSMILCSPRTSWAGHLSDDILQNQEKLLAMLEHETSLVERAVMDRASLKHTYQPGDHPSSEGVSGSTSFEYQCDPLLPPASPLHSAPASVSLTTPIIGGADANTSSVEEVSSFSMTMYANWHLAPQVRDLFLAFHAPLLKLLVRYTSGQRTPALGNQYCLSAAAVFCMLTDFKLHPAFLSRDHVQTLFDRFCDSADVCGSLLAPQGFTLLIGSCALELYARSLAGGQAQPHFFLSTREILLSFFGDLGLLAEGEVPPASELCFVGMDVETVLWPLFEYYAKSTNESVDGEENLSVRNDARVGMTSVAFECFMTDIAGKAASESRAIFLRVMEDLSKKQNYCADEEKGGERLWKMHLDEFYIGISYAQIERNPGTTPPTPGEAVRQWLQHTQ